MSRLSRLSEIDNVDGIPFSFLDDVERVAALDYEPTDGNSL